MNRRIAIGAALGAVTMTAIARVSTRAKVVSDIGALARTSACSADPRPRLMRASSSSQRLVFAGTRLFKEGFLDDLGAAYQRATGREIEILGGGCDDGLEAVRTRQASIGGLCCPLAGSPAAGMRFITVAHDLKVVVAHPKIAVDNLSWKQLTELLTGGIHNWRDIGGRDQPVALVLHDHCPDYHEPARRMVLGDRRDWSRDALYVKTDQKHLDTVARFESAVGINSWILAEPYVRSGRLKVIAVDAVLPTIDNAARKRYRLVGPMNMIFEPANESLAEPFFAFLFSASGQSIIRRRLVPIRQGLPRAARGVRA